MAKDYIHLGLISAMPEEVGETVKNLDLVKTIKYGDLEIFIGFLKTNRRIRITLTWSGWGKVSSARAITRMIGTADKKNPIQVIFFTGVAGSAQKYISQWDIVISDKVIQHDMDARPIFKKFVVPSLNNDLISSNKMWRDWSYKTIKNKLDSEDLQGFGNLYCGIIATGDKFINDEEIFKNLNDEIPDLLAVEMEGAAVAQVAEQEKIPWLIFRVISDSANSSSDISFTEFMKSYKYFSWKLIKTLLADLENSPIA